MISRIHYRFMMLKRLRPYTKGVVFFFCLNIVFSFVLMGCELGTPVFYKIFINQVIIERQFEKICLVFAGYLFLFALSSVAGYLKTHVSYRVQNTVLYRVKQMLWNYFLQIPFEEYEHLETGAVKMKMEDDCSQIKVFVDKQTIDYLTAYITAAISLLILCTIDWRLTIFSAISIPITFMLDSYVSKREYQLREFNRENEEEQLAWLHMIHRNWKEIRALGLEKRCKRSYLTYLHNYALFFAKWINYWTFRVLVIPKIKDEFFMRFGLYFLGGFLIIQNKMNIGELLLFAIYFESFAGAVKSISATDGDLLSSQSLTDRFLADLDKAEHIKTGGGHILDEIQSIQLRNIKFMYGDRLILSDLNMELERGDCLGITGKSGSGKTTLLKIISAMLKPAEGDVLFNGTDVMEIDPQSLYRRMGIISQEVKIFHTTIRNNIGLGDENATDLKCMEACRSANIDAFVESLPNGLDTVLGEEGDNLSGGQRQRLALARLFYQNPDVIVLDEATSALDKNSEVFICQCLEKWKDKIMILVDHRGTLMELCNKRIHL